MRVENLSFRSHFFKLADVIESSFKHGVKNYSFPFSLRCQHAKRRLNIRRDSRIRSSIYFFNSPKLISWNNFYCIFFNFKLSSKFTKFFQNQIQIFFASIFHPNRTFSCHSQNKKSCSFICIWNNLQSMSSKAFNLSAHRNQEFS